jgi:hypothetical protein
LLDFSGRFAYYDSSSAMTFSSSHVRNVLLAAGILLLALTGNIKAATPQELAQRERVSKIQAAELPFEQLTHQQISEAGKAALKIDPKKWRHAESDHFIIHYQLWDVRNRLLRDAEFYYWKVQDDLKLTTDLVKHKSHIFCFQDSESWATFQAATGLSGIAGVTMGNEFFSYYPKKKDKDFSATVAHEMTHLVFNRFFDGRPPLWLNEGFAEFQSHNAYQSLYGKRLGGIRKDTSSVGQIDFMNMTTWTSYQSNMSNNQAFYVKAQLAVDLLIEKGGPEKFQEFINSMIQNPDFRAAFDQNYRGTFKDLNHFLKELARKEKRL